MHTHTARKLFHATRLQQSRVEKEVHCFFSVCWKSFNIIIVIFKIPSKHRVDFYITKSSIMHTHTARKLFHATRLQQSRVEKEVHCFFSVCWKSFNIIIDIFKIPSKHRVEFYITKSSIMHIHTARKLFHATRVRWQHSGSKATFCFMISTIVSLIH